MRRFHWFGTRIWMEFCLAPELLKGFRANVKG